MTTTCVLDFAGRPVRIDIEESWLRGGLGAHELIFDLKVQAGWLPDESPDSHEVLKIHAHFDAGPSLATRPLGQASLMCLTRKFATRERLVVIITDDQLLGLETVRGQGGLDFKIDITATLTERTSGRPGSIATQCNHMVPASRWIELLDQVGASTSITIRVLSPLSDAQSVGAAAAPDSPSAASAGARLRQARRELRDGNFAGSVQTCRFVLDNLKILRPPRPANEIKGTNPQDRDQEQRWSALFHDLYSLASAASHDDPLTQEFKWSREDAQAILGSTAGLLARATT